MEALGILRFWRNTSAGAGAVSIPGVYFSRNPVSGTDEEETDDDDSFFDLVIRSPDQIAAKIHDEGLKDILLRKNDYPSSKPRSPVSILRRGPKFKVFIQGLTKQRRREKTGPIAVELKANPVNRLRGSSKLEQSNRSAAKTGPAASFGPVFTRDNSLRTKMLKESREYGTSPNVLAAGEKSVPRYMKLIKPFYAKASSKARSSEFSTPSSSPLTAPSNQSPRKFCEVSRVGSFKIMTRRLGKSRPASAAVRGKNRTASAADGPPPLCRRDDLLMEHHDGIQGAILHCKKSFNNSSYLEISQLSRSASDNSREKMGRNTSEEQKRCSI
ncbi:spindle pole body component KRE28 [Striga asiatica]|uniref:Spindle pole body component KRE28 n=1 Tax=Striga asiatica TaxID=4170 RepID=A0A5A7PNJ3_STRAF|nr:spindle pole body component KRE28 [Striga asiatica]